MNIALLTQWFDPEPSFWNLKFASMLSQRGHKVQVITGFPNYPEGNLYPGYKIRPIQKEKFKDVTVIRVPLYPSHDSSAVKRVANYGSFALSSAIIGSLASEKPDVIYVYHPPATIGISAMVMSLWKDAPFVYNVQDLWPESIEASGMLTSPLALKIIEKLCISIYKRATRITVLSPGMGKKIAKLGIDGGKIDVIYNWCDEDSFLPSSQNDHGKKDFTLVYAGNMGKVQGMDQVIEGFRLAQSQRPEIKLKLMGGGTETERLKETVERGAIKGVQFIPRGTKEEAGSVMSQADGLIVHLIDKPLFRFTIPSKTQAYMAMGKPLLMGVAGDGADLVKKAECGITFKPQSPESLAKAILCLSDKTEQERKTMGESGRSFYMSHLSMEQGVLQTEATLRRAISDHRGK